MHGMDRRSWSDEENDATVRMYLRMLRAELEGREYRKSDARSELVLQLDRRSPKAVEFKHPNISAVMIRMGLPYIDGYKPRWNYQESLEAAVQRGLAEEPDLIELFERFAARDLVPPDRELKEEQPPSADPDVVKSVSDAPRRTATPVKINYLERDERNAKVGLAGELLVLEYERRRLAALGHHGLAECVEHVSKTRGDHLGYDIMSFDSKGGEVFIEVKSTRFGAESPFFVSRNELEVSERENDRYRLHRVFTLERNPRFFSLSGALSKSCRLEARDFRAFPA